METCKMNGIEPYAYLRELFTKPANCHLELCGKLGDGVI